MLPSSNGYSTVSDASQWSLNGSEMPSNGQLWQNGSQTLEHLPTVLKRVQDALGKLLGGRTVANGQQTGSRRKQKTPLPHHVAEAN